MFSEGREVLHPKVGQVLKNPPDCVKKTGFLKSSYKPFHFHISHTFHTGGVSIWYSRWDKAFPTQLVCVCAHVCV